jgi:hypothetical protein
MSFSIARKLNIKEGDKLLTQNAPSEFRKFLGELPPNVSVTARAKTFTQLHWFVLDKLQMELELPEILKKVMTSHVICWIYFPKRTSKIQTDLTRDKGWNKLLTIKEFKHLSLISFNETWSAFSIRYENKNEKIKVKVKREIFNWVDPITKRVTLPPDLEMELKKNKPEMIFYHTLSFTNKKEYIEWIVSAKKDETRRTRIVETIRKLSLKWKNPRNN